MVHFVHECKFSFFALFPFLSVLPAEHFNMVYDLTFSPDERRVISASSDRSVRVFDFFGAHEFAKHKGFALSFFVHMFGCPCVPLFFLVPCILSCLGVHSFAHVLTLALLAPLGTAAGRPLPRPREW